jgi:hypothetical protein
MAGPLSYVLYDLRSGVYLGSLPLNSVTFGSQLMQTGSFTGQIDIASPAVQALAPISVTQPARTFIGVDYMGSLIWGGIIWPRAYKYDGVSRILTVTASDLSSYFSQRVQATDYSSPPYSAITGTITPMPIWDAASTSGATWDPLLIAWQLISDALAVPNGNLLGGMSVAANGLTTPAAYLASGTATPPGDYLSVNYPYSSLQGLSTMVQQLAANGLGVGFDYAIDCAYTAGPGSPITATVNLSYPRRGRTYANSGLVLNCGSAIEYEPPEDGTQVGNVVYEQGSSGSLVISENVNPINAGYPILEQIKSRSNITSANMLAILTAMGISDLAQISYPVVTPSVTMDMFSSSVPLGDFITGDDVRWLIPTVDQSGNPFDPRFPVGIDSEFRITGYSAQVADAGQSKLTFNLALPPLILSSAPAI